MKVAVVILFLAFHAEFQAFAHGFLAMFPTDAQTQLVLVMLITPCCMNAFQFWLTDNFLKHSNGKLHDHSLFEEVPELQ